VGLVIKAVVMEASVMEAVVRALVEMEVKLVVMPACARVRVGLGDGCEGDG